MAALGELQGTLDDHSDWLPQGGNGRCMSKLGRSRAADTKMSCWLTTGHTVLTRLFHGLSFPYIEFEFSLLIQLSIPKLKSIQSKPKLSPCDQADPSELLNVFKKKTIFSQ